MQRGGAEVTGYEAAAEQEAPPLNVLGSPPGEALLLDRLDAGVFTQGALSVTHPFPRTGPKSGFIYFVGPE
ncbi:hypothetical protein PMJ1TS6_01210 [Paenibacillus melissococcoides]